RRQLLRFRARALRWTHATRARPRVARLARPRDHELGRAARHGPGVRSRDRRRRAGGGGRGRDLQADVGRGWARSCRAAAVAARPHPIVSATPALHLALLLLAPLLADVEVGALALTIALLDQRAARVARGSHHIGLALLPHLPPLLLELLADLLPGHRLPPRTRSRRSAGARRHRLHPRGATSVPVRDRRAA